MKVRRFPLFFGPNSMSLFSWIIEYSENGEVYWAESRFNIRLPWKLQDKLWRFCAKRFKWGMYK